jgi:hypothetical protein
MEKQNSWVHTLMKCAVHAFDHRYVDLSLIDAHMACPVLSPVDTHIGVSCLQRILWTAA